MKIFKVEYEPVISRIIYISAESEEEALNLASEIIDKTNAISFDESDITGILTHVIGAVGEEAVDKSENPDEESDAFQASNLEGS